MVVFYQENSHWLSSLKLVDKFTYLGSSVSLTDADINMRLAKACTAIDRLSVTRKSDLANKIKFFPSSGRFDTAVWMHYMDANKTYDICHCLPPDRTWHKVNDYSGDLGEGKVGHELRLKPSWSVLLIDPLSAMWVSWGKQFHESKFWSGHICWVIAWTRQQGLVLYIGDKGCSSPTWRWPNRS